MKELSNFKIDTCDNPVLTDEMVVLCEKELKITLPDNLKEFLYFANGGIPEKEVIGFIERSRPTGSLVACGFLLCFRDHQLNSRLRTLKFMECTEPESESA